MTGRSRLSRAGLDLIKSFEGFRESASRLADGRWIVGYGHVRSAREGVTISESDAETLLRYDLRAAEDAVSQHVFAPLNQNQYDALVSLAFNISPARFAETGILQALNAGDYLTAAAGFDAWRKARIGGRVMVVDALVRRRAAEKALFLDPPDGRAAAPSPVLVPELDQPGDESDRPPRIPVIAALAPDSEPTQADDAVEHVADALEDAAAPVGLPDIAEAIRHIAEQVGGAARALVSPPAPEPIADAEFETVPDPAGETKPEPDTDAPAVEPAAAEPAETSETFEDARRAMADRVARILERAEKTMAQAQAVVDREEARVEQDAASSATQSEISTQPTEVAPQTPEARLRAIFSSKADTSRSTAQPASDQQAQRIVSRTIPEDLPDFDAEIRARNGNGSRPLIDDTETFNPGRDPTELFEEGVRAEKVVNGHAKRLGPISGRAALVAPWIAILVLSVIGLAIGLVESLRGAVAETGGDALMGAPTILAVFGVMLVMSVYFILTRPLDRK